MNTTKEKIKLDVELTVFTTKSGEKLKVEEKDLARMTQNKIESLEYELKNTCNRMDIVHDFRQIEGKSPKEIASIMFYDKFFIEYEGNPSMNGGHFYYKGYDIQTSDEHFYFLSDPIDGKGYAYRILTSMACTKYYRDWGYGYEQLGYKFVEENEETAKEFIKYIKNYSLISLDMKTIGFPYGGGRNRTLEELEQNLGAGLFWYCIRSNYYEGAEQFKKFVDDKNLIQNLSRLIKEIQEYADDRYKNRFDEKIKLHIEKLVMIMKIVLGDKKTIPTSDAKLNKANELLEEILEEIADSWLNEEMKLIDKKTLKLL